MKKLIEKMQKIPGRTKFFIYFIIAIHGCFFVFADVSILAAVDRSSGQSDENIRIVTPPIVEGQPPDKPIVFVSRNRMGNWNRVHVGPPIDVAGRELAPGGALMLWRPDGTTLNLTEGAGIHDVQQPDVSFDGGRIVFSAVTSPEEQWHLWQINVDGTGLEQLTFDDRDIPIPDDPENSGRNERVFSRYGDFGAAWLPDGRIIFASTRYMTLSGSCGQRGQNLYILDPQQKTVTRRTTERAGAIDPFVLHDGRVAFSHWIDTTNRPAETGGGLRALETDYNYGSSFWAVWAMNPDATDAGRYAFVLGGIRDGGGAFQPHETANHDLAIAIRGHGSLLGDTLASAVTTITPGPTEPQELVLLGDPFQLEGAHALCPAALADGRLIVSYTPTSTIDTDRLGIRTATFDFGLYVTDSEFGSLTPVYNDPLTDELDAAIVEPRQAPVIPDIANADLITDDPAVDLGTTATMVNRNVYADLLPDQALLPSPRVGTVSRIDVYDDSQTFTTSEEFPLLRKQMPRLVGSFPVGADGSFSVEVPADRPLLFVLANQEGVAVRSPMSLLRKQGLGRWITHSFDGHDYLRPQAAIECSGCHKGHMFDPELAMTARTNLSRIAMASGSSEPVPFYAGAWRVNDLRLSNEKGAYAWATRQGPGAWVRLDWPMTLRVDRILVYPLNIPECHVLGATVTLSDGASIVLGEFPADGSPMEVQLNGSHDISWLRVTMDRAESNLVGLAEIVVNGPAENVAFPDTAPPEPVNLRTLENHPVLQWDRNPRRTDEPSVAGYNVYYGTAPGTLDFLADVGNVHRVVLRDLLESGKTCYLAVKSYNVHGTESEAFSNEVSLTLQAPVVASIEPDHGPVGGGTLVTIKGENFAARGVRVMIGGQHARGVTVVDSQTITATTHWHGPGPADVLVNNPDDSQGLLTGGFLYDHPNWAEVSSDK